MKTVLNVILISCVVVVAITVVKEVFITGAGIAYTEGSLIDTPINFNDFVQHDIEIANSLLQGEVKSEAQVQHVYGYEKQTVNSITLVLIFFLLSLALIIHVGLKNLRLQVTLRKTSEAKVKRELLWLQNIINEMPDMVVIHDSENNILLSNGYYNQMAGLFNLESNNNNQLLPLSGEQIRQVLDENAILKQDVKLGENSGEIKHLSLTHKCVEDPASGARFVLSIYHDITVVKAQEIHLIKANRQIEKAMDSRSQFLATMSHELRTPIAGMVGLLELLKKQVATREDVSLVEYIQASTTNLQLLVNDILDFSKIEAGQLSLDASQTDIVKVVSELLRLHQAAAEEKGLAFDVHWHPFDLQYMDIDSLRFSQVINNILSNAIKFTDAGRVRIDVAIVRNQLTITIADTGIGITSSKLGKLFEPFEQGDSSIARKFGGTGLGLSIVANLVDLLAGEIRVESEIEQGTTVYLNFPIVNGLAFERQTHFKRIQYDGDNDLVSGWLSVWGTSNGRDSGVQMTMSDDSPEFISGSYQRLNEDKKSFRLSLLPFYPDLLRNLIYLAESSNDVKQAKLETGYKTKVLVAEDNPINRMLIEKQLTSLGIGFKTVNDGEQAYRELERSADEYHLLITDYHMPNMDGLTLARLVREHLPAFATKNIIGVTAEASEQTDSTIKKGGFDRLLYKPYRLDELEEVLRESLIPLAEERKADWLLKYDEDTAKSFSEIFIETMSSDMKSLNYHLDNYSENEIKKIVHHIKGGAIAVGVISISDVAIKVESLILKKQGKEIIIRESRLLLDIICEEVEGVIAFNKTKINL